MMRGARLDRPLKIINMKIICGINKIRKFKKPVVALGVFDGVHVGHRRILKAAAEKARRIKGTSIVVTFWPDPHKEESLYSLEHRLRLIGQTGVGVCIVIKFNKVFSRLSAQDFVKEVLAKRIGARYVYVGRNFRFGKGAKGNYAFLGRSSRIYNFKLKLFDMVKVNRRPVSSTYIRGLIKKGKINYAAKLLTRPVSVLGTVIKGESLATKLGFPTANIDPHHEVLPPPGIYAAYAIFNKKEYKGACYIGSRPTFGNGPRRIEMHIFGFSKNIYGKYMEIRFVRKIRGDRKFNSKEALATQIKKDVLFSRKVFPLHF